MLLEVGLKKGMCLLNNKEERVGTNHTTTYNSPTPRFLTILIHYLVH